MARKSIAATMCAGALVLAGCGQAATPSGPGMSSPGAADEAASALNVVGDLDDADVPGLADAVNAFGFDLLGAVAEPGENTVTSPVSVATLLAMVMAGADGATAEAMAEVLHLDDPRDARFGALLRTLTDTDDVTLSVSNALWADTGVPFEEGYVDVVSDVFDATVQEAELDDQETADAIDAWVRDRTQGRIEEIADALDLPDPMTVLVLLNAVYFMGEWTTAFDPADTAQEPFTRADGSVIDVPTMHVSDTEFEHGVGDGFQMLRLPYGEDGRYAMEIVLPDEGIALPTLLESFDAETWQETVGALRPKTINDLALPRFEVSWEAQLQQALTELGMGSAFAGGDFSRMSVMDPDLGPVAHKTYLRVDEAGTEAAAVSGGAMIVSYFGFEVNRPFAFTISDQETGAMLFLGTINDPTATS